MRDAPQLKALIWEWPLRVWHWAFALCVLGSLSTGLSGEIAWMDEHLIFGFCAAGLLLFRFLWGFIGGTYSRWSSYRTSPVRFIDHFRGRGTSEPHTAPGIVLGLVLLFAVAGQVTSGLFATDDIFIEGPLVDYASDDVVSFMTATHHRLFWLVIALIATHLTAHLVYGLRRDPTPLSMFTGRKPTSRPLPSTASFGIRGLGVAAISAALIWVALALL